MRALWAAVALFACGEVNKIPDAAVPDAYAPDSPDEVSCAPGEMSCAGTCANLQTSEEYCGNCNTQCAPNAVCTAGVCLAVNTSCNRVREIDPAATNGAFTNPNTGNSFYCDFDNAITYEGFGLGQFNAAYTGYTLMSSGNFNDAAIQRAFIGLVNHQGGLINLAPGLSPGNCCFKSSDAPAGQMLRLAGHYLYPARVGMDQTQCSGPYNDTRYRFYEAEAGPYAPLPLPADYFSGRLASVAMACGDSNNPGIFMRRRAGLN